MLPPVVHALVSEYLRAVDRAAPGLVEGLYLVGSLALDDFRPGRSDVDFVAAIPSRPSELHVHALQRVHAELRRRWWWPHFDGIYASWGDLGADPQTLRHCVSAHEGHVEPAAGDIIAWHTLAHYGVAVRGPAVAELRIWSDPLVLAAWTNKNLDAYWRFRVLDRSARLLTANGLSGLSEWYCEWCVTGVSRQHYTLASGNITSKSGAAVYAAATFHRRWSRVIREAVRIRRGGHGRSLYCSPLKRRREVRAFTAFVIDDAHRLYQERYEVLRATG